MKKIERWGIVAVVEDPRTHHLKYLVHSHSNAAWVRAKMYDYAEDVLCKLRYYEGPIFNTKARAEERVQKVLAARHRSHRSLSPHAKLYTVQLQPTSSSYFFSTSNILKAHFDKQQTAFDWTDSGVRAGEYAPGKRVAVQKQNTLDDPQDGDAVASAIARFVYAAAAVEEAEDAKKAEALTQAIERAKAACARRETESLAARRAAEAEAHSAKLAAERGPEWHSHWKVGEALSSKGAPTVNIGAYWDD